MLQFNCVIFMCPLKGEVAAEHFKLGTTATVPCLEAPGER